MASVGSEPTVTDIVYINRPGDENEELRYSLRSIENLPHGNVWIAGYTPTWVRDVRVIPVERMRDKQTSALQNLIAACQHPDVSDPFYVFNDDFYIMRPMQEIPVLHMGPLQRVIEEHRKGSAYRNAMEKTYDRLLSLEVPENDIGMLVSYELHAPMLIEKTGMLMALDLGKGIYGLHNRTMYGNLMGIGGTQARDVKVYRNDKSSEYREWALISTSDRTWRYHPVGRYIRDRFPDASPHEIEGRVKRFPRRTAVRVHHSDIVHPQI